MAITEKDQHIEIVRKHPTLEHDCQQLVADSLQEVLLVLSDLALLGKQAHWNLVGPRFRELHLQLDELVTAWRLAADEVAERAVALGGVPDGSAGTIAGRSPLSGLPIRTIQDSEVTELFTGVLSESVTRVRTCMDAVEEPEPVTADLLHGIVETLEEQLWMIQVQNITA